MAAVRRSRASPIWPGVAPGARRDNGHEETHLRRTLVAMLVLCLLPGSVPALDSDHATSDESTFEVTETGPRAYRARGSFVVGASETAAWDAIADYEAIPRVASSVKISRVRSRDGNKVMVEQEAVASFLFFSKRTHLLLEVMENRPGEITFRDTAGREFKSYEGFWKIEKVAGGLRVSYGIDVERDFSAPDFLAKRYFRKQVESMMDAMRLEILRRDVATHPAASNP